MIETNRILGVEEREKTGERYRMVMEGGRIKSAGASLVHLYKVASPILQTPDSVEAAFRTAKAFAGFKEKPPIEIRKAFFPQDEGSMRAAFKGSGIYRPTIKTDQGPGGNVGYFHVGNETQIIGEIIKEEGIALEEEFLKKRFE